ncbi:nucleic acid/nucleotide deaminase of polymorphic system toxin [Micromonospora sp. Llam0]|uniref:DddA-like double-stranded DNA deaminase toxin n=1 Tax=Micromonospora sp. Llam0 TaxID=2485143 RepID=UPI000F48EB03|nr:DddA-like double-stranded DNA deaminase toxin [Micromonospora sp. Llam0]ROO63099.1 nucleic acid/nucleotide deaminase of polymorphic system toxin [Micromonospora sp. Llam0]
MSLDEVAAGLQTVLEQIARQRACLAATVSSVNAASNRLQAVTAGSDHILVRQALAAAAASTTRLSEADRHLAEATMAIIEYGKAIGVVLALPRDSAPPAAAAASTRPEAAGSRREVSPQPRAAAETASGQSTPAGDAAPAPYVPGFLESLPVRRSADAPTNGVITTTDGERISDVHSGKGGPGKGGPGLRPPFKHYVSALDHAEGHAAALMRTRGLTAATLYLNNTPCVEPMGCDRVLPYVLPKDTTLTVYGPNRYVTVYQGNGKGLA